MMRTIKLSFIFFLVLLFKLGSTNNCTFQEISYLDSTNRIESLVFNCFGDSPINPVIPNSSNPKKYNVIDLSPNVYSIIPKVQLCSFINTTSLDLSYNLIKSADFKDFSCLTSLISINLANNQINSSILSSDFEYKFSSRLESLNLTKNLIGYIESKTFIKNDGSSRFPRLKYLGLGYNRLKSLDLLWPLTIPNENLLIELKYNNISIFKNEMNLNFDNQILKYPMTNNRKLDATTNSLQGFDDQSLLQYGLKNQDNLKEFLEKISNYDFRQANLVPTFICFCPSTGQSTLFWFSLISNFMNRSKPIFQIYCINSPSTYVLDFPCNQTNQDISFSTYSSSFSTFQTNINDIGNSSPDFANQLASTAIQKIDTNQNQINSGYFYLLFLIIPIILFFIVLFLCGIGRFFQVRTYKYCKSCCCQIFRKEDESVIYNNFDGIICYNIFDEEFALKFQSQLIDYKGIKVSLLNVSEEKSTKNIFNKLKNSSRIILIVSPEFFKNEYSEKKFLKSIKILSMEKKNLVIILLNKGVDKKKLNKIYKYLDTSYNHHGSKKLFFFILHKIKSTIKFNLGLKPIEKVNYNDQKFWRNFLYLMPYQKSINYKENENDQNLKKIKSREFSQQKYTDSKLSYAREYNDTKKLNHVIIPIPDFMRTSLGFKKSENLDSNFKKDQNFPIIHQKSKKLQKNVKNEDQLNKIQFNSKTIKNNNDFSENQNSFKKERSESADILAMFAPTQNSIYPLTVSDKINSYKE